MFMITDGNEKVDFDFLVDGEFMRLALAAHMESKHISTVSIIWKDCLLC